MAYIYAIDGDDIGKKIEESLFNDDLSGASEISSTVENALRKLNELFVSKGAETIFLAGDSVLLKSKSFIDLPISSYRFGLVTFSVGIGNSPSSAVLALKKAKGLGKSRVIDMSQGEL